jgi:hypothetical protein
VAKEAKPKPASKKAAAAKGMASMASFFGKKT